MTLRDALERPGPSIVDDLVGWELATTSLLLERLTGLAGRELYSGQKSIVAARLLLRAAQKRRACS